MGDLDNIVINTKTGLRGPPRDFVARFEELWANPSAQVDEFSELLAANVRLVAPMGRTTVGHADGLRALRRIFTALPDLRATVLRWAETDDALFIEMQFTATIGGREITWWNVDRFRFEGGVAVERVAYFDPSVLRRAFLGSVRGWVQLSRLRKRPRYG